MKVSYPTLGLLLLVLLLAVLGLTIAFSRTPRTEPAETTESVETPEPIGTAATVATQEIRTISRKSAVARALVAPETAEDTDTEASAADPEEAQVAAFEALTDRWQEPAAAGVTMKDVTDFVVAFRQIPKERQDESVHRALNLIPDENALLLAGLLMDKSLDKEIVETVFNDSLNRGEDVKMPLLRQVLKDKSHPCRADAAWILDATGETR